MTRKAILLSSACLFLSGCITDKVSMSSEVGGSSSPNVSVSRNAAPSGQPSGGGLGLTGETGTLANVLGEDPVGGVLDASLGQGNILSDLLGSSSESGTGFLPALAAAASGQGSSDIFGPGTGITGDGGIVSDLVGTDLGGALLGSEGIIPAGVAGGNDGLLGALLADENANPALTTISQLLPISSVIAGYSRIPALGLTGEGGVSDALLGNNMAGNVLGSDGLLGGGGDGALAGQLPAGSIPLDAVGQVAVDTLNVVAGNAESPLGSLGGIPGSGTSTLQSGLDQTLGAISSSTGTDLSGSIVPVLQDLGSVTSMPQASAVLSSATSSLPVVGGLLSSP